MATPVFTSLTRGEIFRLLAERVGDLIANGTTSTTGVANTLVDAVAGSSGLIRFYTDNDPRIYRKQVTIAKGTRAGDSTGISAFTASSKTITPSPNFGGNLSTDSEYVIHDRFTYRECTFAIQQAARMLAYDRTLGMGLLKEEIGRQIMIGNAVVNGVLDLFTTTNVPDSWTTTNMTATSETTVTFGGCRRSLKLVTDGANVANLTQSLTEAGRWAGQTFEAWAWVFCETASQMYLRVSDGVANHDSSLHGGTGWEKLRVTVTVDANTDAMTASIRSTTAASTITFYVQCVWVPLASSNDHAYALDADVNLVALSGTLRVSDVFPSSTGGSSAAGNFMYHIQPSAWEIAYESTRKIRLHIGSEWNGRVLEYTGWKNHAELTAVTTTWAGPIDALLDVAAAILNASKVSPAQVPSIERVSGGTGNADVDGTRMRVLRRDGVRVGMGAKLVETIL